MSVSDACISTRASLTLRSWACCLLHFSLICNSSDHLMGLFILKQSSKRYKSHLDSFFIPGFVFYCSLYFCSVLYVCIVHMPFLFHWLILTFMLSNYYDVLQINFPLECPCSLSGDQLIAYVSPQRN